MRCPHLTELPPAPEGRVGWPWTEECPRLPERTEDGLQWPLISIVTPSFNQGRFLEETIRSVLLQGYPDLQYVIVDGGSGDESVGIIRKYERWLDYWVSERDRGQSHAINKGFARVSGQLFNWINSDDCLAPEALRCIGTASALNPGRIICGAVLSVHEDGRSQRFANEGLSLESMLRICPNGSYHQPGVFLPTAALGGGEPLDEALRFAMDWDVTLRALKWTSAVTIADTVAVFRVHGGSKTSLESGLFLSEICDVVFRHRGSVEGHSRREWARVFAAFSTRAAGRCLVRGRVGCAAHHLIRAARTDVLAAAGACAGLATGHLWRRACRWRGRPGAGAGECMIHKA